MSSNTKKIESITLRVDPETKASLEELAQEDQRTLSAFILKALRERYPLLNSPKSKLKGK
jgi:uncharacterized protein (DUF1778 family)